MGRWQVCGTHDLIFIFLSSFNFSTRIYMHMAQKFQRYKGCIMRNNFPLLLDLQPPDSLPKATIQLFFFLALLTACGSFRASVQPGATAMTIARSLTCWQLTFSEIFHACSSIYMYMLDVSKDASVIFCFLTLQLSIHRC